MPDAVVLYEVDEHVATITLNRPSRMNAIVPAMREGLLNAFHEASADQFVRAIVLTGAGDSFCAGGDTKEMTRVLSEGAENLSDTEHKVMPVQNRVVLAMHRTEKPIIAAINGACAGGGMGMALASDIRIASTSAVFSMAFGRIGLSPEWGLTYYLPRIVGEDRAKELLWMANKLSAEDALKERLITRIVAQGKALGEALELAHELAKRAPYPVRLVKKGLQRSQSYSIEEALDYESYARVSCLASEDFVEGLNARQEKRHPVFKGR